jgi:nucleotide-binding universal stress UspA family protein
MASPTVGLTEQMLRRRPVLGAPVAHGASTALKRTIGTFQLTLFGVGATVGTGIFFVLSQAVPEAGPAVMISFLIAGIAADSANHAQKCVAEIGTDIEVSYHKYAHRSAPGGLVAAVEELKADALVLGSAADGKLGQVVVGSTADRLLHSSPVPLAISPRGYRGSKSHGMTRITCAYPGTPESLHVVERVASLAAQLEVPMRVITFAVRGRTMYPPEVGLHAEDSILQTWASHSRESLAALKSDGVVGNDVTLQVVTGNGWDQALDAAEWLDGELLALGTSPQGALARVFLGSKGTKIVRHSPVPVLVLPN